MTSDVLVVIGVGGMGRAIARRLGAGKTAILADFDESTLRASAAALCNDGYDVHAQTVDVASPESVASLVHAVQFIDVLRGYRLPVDAPSAPVLREAAATCPTG